jgi:hypothetical protein
MTLVDYFSSTVELAGMRRMVEDDIAKRVQRLTRRGLSNRPTPLVLNELTSRVNSADIATALAAAGNQFRSDLDSTAARDHEKQLSLNIREAKNSKDQAAARHALDEHWAKRTYAERPVDVVLATSMLQVGVDVSRLGLMVVTGQPKNSAEYIQASSRVGRDANRPGLVTVIYNWARPRDLAHFETFGHFHETAYAKVEALSVTPFADRALDRGLAAVLVALIRHTRPEFEHEGGAHAVPDHLTAPDVKEAVEVIAARAEFVTAEPAAGTRVREQAARLLDLWAKRRKALETGGLTYTKAGDTAHPLLESSPTRWDEFSVGWSLREVEPEINLLLRIEAPELAERPDWTYGPPKNLAPIPPDSSAEDDEAEGDDEPEEELPPAKDGGFDETGTVNLADSPAGPPQGETDR